MSTEMKADVTLLLEGTYPYVSGGVSSWVHQIICGLPEIKFSLVFLGGAKHQYGEKKYTLPDNVVHLESHYLMEAGQDLRPHTRSGNAECFADSQRVHDFFRDPKVKPSPELLHRFLENIGKPTGISAEDFLLSRASWDSICENYHRFCMNTSF